MKKIFKGVFNYKTNKILCEEHDMFFFLSKEEITDHNMIFFVNDKTFQELIDHPPIMEDTGDDLDTDSILMFEINNMGEQEFKRISELVDIITKQLRSGKSVDLKLVEEYNVTSYLL